MAITLEHFEFFDSGSTLVESPVLKNLETAEEMILQVTGSGTINLTIKAKTEDPDATWHNISSVALNGYSVCNSITQAGLYDVPLTGISSIKITNNGSTGISVYGEVMG